MKENGSYFKLKGNNLVYGLVRAGVDWSDIPLPGITQEYRTTVSHVCRDTYLVFGESNLIIIVDVQSIKYMHVALADVANEAKKLGQSDNVQSPSKRFDKKCFRKKKWIEIFCFGPAEKRGGGGGWSRTVFSGRPSVGSLFLSSISCVFVSVNIVKKAPRSTALIAHTTNVSLDGLCTHTHKY